MFEDSPLRQSLDALASFFVGRSDMSETLLNVSELAITAIPSAQFIGLTLLVNGKPATAIYTDSTSPEVDQAQYHSGRGPCLDAFTTGEIRSIRSMSIPNQWPEFSKACLAHGIHSTLSLPLAVAGTPFGAMNVYAKTEDAFDGNDLETAVLFAAQASIVLGNAQAYWDARSLGEQLSESIISRQIIEQAKGIVMGSTRCSADEAYRYLVDQSQQTNVKLRTVAQDIVNHTTRCHPDNT